MATHAVDGCEVNAPGSLSGGRKPPEHATAQGAYARRSANRAGFTLIELMVVIALILVLAAIAVLFVPRVQDGDKAAGGARQLMGMLQIAKTRAMRDQAPRGVRLLPSAADPNLILEAQYIEKPADFYDPKSAALGLTRGAGAVGPVLSFANVDFTGGMPTPDLWPVQKGDWLEVNGGGLVRRIEQVIPPDKLQLAIVYTYGTLLSKPKFVPAQIKLDFPVPANVGTGSALTFGKPLPTGLPDPTTVETAAVLTAAGPLIMASQCNQLSPTFLVQNDPPLTVPLNCPYRIIRGPRPVAGEDGLTLPVDVAVQLKALLKPNYDPPGTTPLPGTTYYDILFSPSGAVIGAGAANDKIICWVRDVSQPNATDNNPVLVCIYTRSGLIAAHPVDVASGNFYSFTVDGKSSGE